MHARTGDVEVNVVGTGIGIGIQDGLAKGSGTRIVRVGHRIGGQHPFPGILGRLANHDRRFNEARGDL